MLTNHYNLPSHATLEPPPHHNLTFVAASEGGDSELVFSDFQMSHERAQAVATAMSGYGRMAGSASTRSSRGDIAVVEPST